MNKEAVNKKENELHLREKMEDFLHSNTPSATATKILLAILGLGALAFGGAVIPGIIKAMEGFRGYNTGGKKKKYTNKQVSDALSSLKRYKLVRIVKGKDGKFKVRLTNKGKKRLLKLSLETVSIQKPEVWDGKWRIVIFDIPTELNSAREALRGKIKKLGLKQLQKSVWVHPYDCEDEILFIAEAFDIEKYVEIMVAEKVLHEKVLKDAFKIE